MMKSEDIAKGKQSCGSRLRDDVSKIFDCFLIVNHPDKNQKSDVKWDYKYPKNFNDEEILQQSYLFCFPFSASTTVSALRDHTSSHFTFILTDIEGKHRFGFCKLTNERTKCYCVLSFLPWFEIFYKILNYTHELALKFDEETMETMLMELHQQPVPEANDKLQFSPTLSFSVPDAHTLPSIPGNINLTQYYAAVNFNFMMEVFASLMFERRIIFTSKSLGVLTSCIHSAESLLNPLHWQHIFIPVMPPHLLDYCLAPMPFLVGVHSSLMPKVREMVAMDDDIIIADIDKEEIESAHNDSERIPNDTMSFLKSLLRKDEVKVGQNLALAFLRTQARLIGGYRRGLKFRQGEPIVFDEDKFIESYKSNTTKEFARSLVQLQTFKQFVDGRLDMLNSGIGFRDDFENEVNVVDAASSREGDTYKEWLNAAKKGGNKLFIQMQRMAKDNMKSAQQTWKNYVKQQQIKQQESAVNRQKSLDQSTQRIRPSRPPPIDPEKLAEHRRQRALLRPPPPTNFPKAPLRSKATKRTTRIYTELVLDNDEQATTSDIARERSISDASLPCFNLDLMADMTQVLDQKMNEINTTPLNETSEEPNLLIDINSISADASKSEDESSEISNLRPIDKKRTSEIRRRNQVSSRPNALKHIAKDQSSSSAETSPDVEVNVTSGTTAQLIDFASSETKSETSTLPTPTTSQSTASTDLLSLDFSSFGVDQTSTSDSEKNEANWARFDNPPKAERSHFFDLPAHNVPITTADTFQTHGPALSSLISSNPFVTGQMSSGSSRSSSPSRTPNKLNPEKLNPFKAKQTEAPLLNFQRQQTFPTLASHYNDFSKTSPVHNTERASLHVNNSNKTLPVQTGLYWSPHHRSATRTTQSNLRQTPDNELFSDLLETWKNK